MPQYSDVFGWPRAQSSWTTVEGSSLVTAVATRCWCLRNRSPPCSNVWPPRTSSVLYFDRWRCRSWRVSVVGLELLKVWCTCCHRWFDEWHSLRCSWGGSLNCRVLCWSRPHLVCVRNVKCKCELWCDEMIISLKVFSSRCGTARLYGYYRAISRKRRIRI